MTQLVHSCGTFPTMDANRPPVQAHTNSDGFGEINLGYELPDIAETRKQMRSIESHCKKCFSCSSTCMLATRNDDLDRPTDVLNPSLQRKQDFAETLKQMRIIALDYRKCINCRSMLETRNDDHFQAVDNVQMNVKLEDELDTPNDVINPSLLEQAFKEKELIPCTRALVDVLQSGYEFASGDIMQICRDIMFQLDSRHAKSRVYGDVQDVNRKLEQTSQQVPKLRDGGQGLGLASSSSGASNRGLQPDPQAADNQCLEPRFGDLDIQAPVLKPGALDDELAPTMNSPGLVAAASHSHKILMAGVNSKLQEVKGSKKNKNKEMCAGGQVPGQASSSLGPCSNLGPQPNPLVEPRSGAVAETEDCLEYSIKCYKACLDDKHGNACNERGVFWMNIAEKYASVKDSKPSKFEQLCKRSYHYFDTGVKSYEKVSDSPDVAFLNGNMGRLMRLCAWGSMGPDSEFSTKEKHYYLKAAEYYKGGLQILGNKSGCVELWDSITWDLCSTYFIMACQMQDRPPVSTSNLAEIEKDVLKFMCKAMALCDTNTTSSRQPLSVYQDRAATIHLRLASMNHNSMRNQNTKTMAKLHYNKAIKLFKEMDSPGELLRKELKRLTLLLEHQVENQVGEQEAQDEARRHVTKKGKVRGLGNMTTLACRFLGDITTLGQQQDPQAVDRQATEPEPGAVFRQGLHSLGSVGADTHETLMADFEMERFMGPVP